MTKKLKMKTVDTLERNDCRGPICVPRHPEFHLYGATQLSGHPYCELHWRMAFQPSRPRSAPPAVILTGRRAA